MALADGPYETVGSIPTEITIDVTDSSVIWNIDIDIAACFPPSGSINDKVNYALVISLDKVNPAFQIHNNDGTDATYAWGTHLYSPWGPEGTGWNGWNTSNTNTLVSTLDWVDATGGYKLVDNADGIFTITIDKAELGLEFYWAVAIMGRTCDTHYPEAWAMWSGDASTFEVVTVPPPPAPIRSPDAFDVFVRFGYDSTRYTSNDQLIGSIEAAGEYNGTRYMLEIPKGCVVAGTTGRINWLWLASIDGAVLSFVGGDASFSEPCTLYITDGGRLYQDYWTGEWLGGGEWIEVGTFNEIIDGEAVLD